MFLYAKHYDGFWNFLFVHIKASLGDVLIFAILYLMLAIAFRNFKWFLEKNVWQYFLVALFGFFIAVIIERYALATNRWQYNELMPIIPFFKVGMSPVIQLIILPIITIVFSKKLYTIKTKKAQ